jgi:lysophospholipase L1-like esterase
MKRAFLFALIALVGIEVAWQLAALVTRNLYPRSVASAPREGALTILCVGDSHTYGAPLPEPESYPFQLERSLRSTYEHDIQVVNLGVPGMNTPMVANRLEGQIARLHPDLVIVWAGVNSFWNATETESWNGFTNALRGWLFRLRTVRFVAIVWFNMTGFTHARAELLEWVGDRTTWQFGEERVVMDKIDEGEGDSLSEERVRNGLRFDYTRIILTARSYETPILFITYPYEAGIFRTANDTLREVAAEHGVEVIVTESALERARSDGFTTDELVVDASGPHPREILYRYVVEQMFPEVTKLLGLPQPNGGRHSSLRLIPGVTRLG